MKLAIIGATGLVGEEILKVLKERNINFNKLYLVASKESVGKTIHFCNVVYNIMSIDEVIKQPIDVAIFSVGKNISLEWAPVFSKKGITVIDNSSAWRMDSTKKLVIPEINADAITLEDKIIANPNCSTIQLVLALAPLHKAYKMRRVIVSTYQSVSGSGVKAIQQMENEIQGIKGPMVYPYAIFKNALPHCDVFLENGYTKEEMKMVNETRKILGDDSVQVCPTTVRVPVFYSHSEALNIETEGPITGSAVKELLKDQSGISVVDDPLNNEYPLAIEGEDKNEVFVGRIRNDISCERAVNLWVVSDNLRKGAALNAVQIAELLISR